jgi:hypothetical protein
MKQIIPAKNLIFLDDDAAPVSIDCSALAPDVAFAGWDGNEKWIELHPFTGRIYEYDFTAIDALFDQAQIAFDEREAAMQPDPNAVPAAVTMRQARLALLNAGLLSSVETFIGALPSPEKEAAQIEWDYAAEIRRDHALVIQMENAMGMTSEQMDALFVAARAIV